MPIKPPDDICLNKAAIHQYQELDMDILRHIAEEGWTDLRYFCQALGLHIKV